MFLRFFLLLLLAAVAVDAIKCFRGVIDYEKKERQENLRLRQRMHATYDSGRKPARVPMTYYNPHKEDEDFDLIECKGHNTVCGKAENSWHLVKDCVLQSQCNEGSFDFEKKYLSLWCCNKDGCNTAGTLTTAATTVAVMINMFL